MSISTATTVSEPCSPLDAELTLREYLMHGLQSIGFSSATDYAESLPRASLEELAEGLGLAAIPMVEIELESKLVEEAVERGTVEHCARSLLARDLLQELPEGWPIEWTTAAPGELNELFRRHKVFHSLILALPAVYHAGIERVRKAMDIASIAPGWHPEGAFDPVLMEMFGNYFAERPCPGTQEDSQTIVQESDPNAI